MTEPVNDTMPVRKTVTVPVPPQRAFELFTARFGEWWPLATHSVGEDQATGVAFGEGIGGSIVESLADGTTSVWGTITSWNPPHSVAYTWHAGTPVAESTSVEVTFTPADEGHTVVELVHSGWENRPDGSAARTGYETGWDPVIKHYVRFAATSGLPARAT
jgi:uncharacterized protein YndB with AHSA1/START domain